MSNDLQERTQKVDDAFLDAIFRNARTTSVWLDRPVPNNVIHELYDLLKLGPTSANLTPGRFVFVTSPEAKERLIPAMMAGNADKTRKAPVTVIVAYDSEFYEKASELFPLRDMKPLFEGKPEAIKHSGEQNANLQAAYLILAARALGLAAGPMGGFSAEAVDKEFFPDGKWRSILVVNLGYPDASPVPPRLPRLSFDVAAKIV